MNLRSIVEFTALNILLYYTVDIDVNDNMHHNWKV